MKQNKQIYIDFIISELNKGNVQYKDVMLVFVSKFELTEQTFVRYWKQANENHKEQRELINNAKTEQTIETEKEAVKKAILQKHEALEILTEIARGKAKKVEGQIIMPSPNERKGAIETMMKMEGWTAPIKTENTNIELKQPFFGNMDLDE
jgi:hypothetical protein